MPKSNMYQSLHTTLIGPSGQPFEIQIRTYEMHRIAEYGIAAHWKYKESGEGTTVAGEEAKLSWLRQILEWQRETDDNKEFVSDVKTDLNLFTEQVYCFTPDGDVKSLPSGSTPIDFAYSIHSAVGNKMVGARVNGRQVPIEYELQNGDRVEIVTSQNSKGPSRDWIGIVKSTQAKNKINQWFKREFKEDNIQRGKELLAAYCKAKSYNFSEYAKPEYLQKVINRYRFMDWESVLAAIGHGGLKESQVMNRLIDEYNKDHPQQVTDEDVLAMHNTNAEKLKRKKSLSGGVRVKGMEDMAVRFSKCCSPVRGDEIVGFITRGRGISIHRTDCPNLLSLPEHERARMIEAEWECEPGDDLETFSAEITIYANDRKGILLDLSKIFTEAGINVSSMNTRTSKQGLATISVTIDIKGIDQLNTLIGKIRNVESIVDIERNAG